MTEQEFRRQQADDDAIALLAEQESLNPLEHALRPTWQIDWILGILGAVGHVRLKMHIDH